ncbi:hypothetical protein D5R93_05835 [Actinomyces lilanjuaniae]|uniref:Holliday junction resolvase n=1 Tax=Actinomyces lilanjuaniae TaxID=2321394 RepID=A0ABM6Z3B5_9ACTO|nr:hypothetical protein [Actinomyces lilanjuaniae]AYD89689.1 hypothetical protein D5R93_05835 [Actinomyces lilanjuaniae]
MSAAPVWEAVVRLAASDVLSLNDRRHWSQAAPRRRAIRQVAAQTAVVGRAPRLRRARLAVEIAFPDRRRRDPHNFMATVKPIVDGLVDAGVLPDDDAAHLLGPDLRRATDITTRRLGQAVYEFRLALYDKGDQP